MLEVGTSLAMGGIQEEQFNSDHSCRCYSFEGLADKDGCEVLGWGLLMGEKLLNSL